MKKGISIWSFAEPDLKKCFLLAKDAGFDGVEVALDTAGIINLDCTKEDMEQVKSWAQEAGIALYSVASGLYWKQNYTSNDPQTRSNAIAITKKQLQVLWAWTLSPAAKWWNTMWRMSAALLL